MTNTKILSCFCGAVQASVEGDPVTQGYCHCTSCRAWTAQPVTAYALWPAALVKVTEGDTLIASAARNERLMMHYCSKCGGNLFASSETSGLTDVFPMLIEGFEFVPQCHVNYAERAIDMRDGLPKFSDMPEQAGGSGTMLPE